MIELERRWKIKEYPSEQVSQEITIEQYYIIKNGRFHSRLRKSVTYEETWYTHCSKYYIGAEAREEFESYLTVNSFERILSLYPNAKKETKKRIIINIPDSNGLSAEIDIFQDGKMIVEVEFWNINQMEKFISPSWFGEEIKEKKFSFSNEKYIW